MQTIDSIGMTKNLELYQTLVGISDPRWSYSTVECGGSAALEQFFPEPELCQTRPKFTKLGIHR
jgi:hypothetical protein